MYRAYVTLGAQYYREQFGLDFEDFQVGQKFRHRPGVTISQQDNKEEALDTINGAQLHYDGFYASQTEWKKCLGVSTLTIQRLMGMTCKTFAKRAAITAFDDIAMTHPVFGEDTLYAETEVLAKQDLPQDSEKGLLKLLTVGLNQNKEVVSKITYDALIYKKGQHPLDRGSKAVPAPQESKFLSHRQDPDGLYMEQTGIYFEDLEPNDFFEHRPGKTFTSEEHRLHVLRSLDLSPQFSDQHYIKTHLGGKEAINEVFILDITCTLTTRTFDRVVANLGWTHAKMHAPVYVGDTIYAASKVLDKRESHSRPTEGIMHVYTEARNQKGDLVCEFERHFLIYKKGLGPYAAAGY